ncbi:hypothetical protein [Palleronia sp.]|uniref:hypothetical protein n=1 Tax=Palleronia sp. TaxID=1940284 RepID=UPI0035C7A240
MTHDLAPLWSTRLRFPSAVPAHIEGTIEGMAACPRDVYTAKIPQAMNLYRNIEKGAIWPMRMASRPLTVTGCLRVLCTLETFSRIARLPAVEMLDGNYWLSPKGPDGTRAVRRRDRLPVMTLDALSQLSGFSKELVQVLLQPLTRDGAVRLVTLPDGRSAVALNSGYMNEEEVRRFYA